MNQETYFLRELNRALPVQRSPGDMSTIQAALDGVDPVLPVGARQAAMDIRMFSQFGQGGDSAVLQQDAACRAYTAPAQSMRADPTSRTGCGWWFSSDPTVNSAGSYGTRRGPMNPNLASQVGPGQWVWDVNQAIQMESAKQAARVQACTDLPYAQNRFPTMGWCVTTNRAVLTDGNGNPAFPRAPGSDCDQSQIVLNAANCPPPPSAGPSGGGSISGLCSTSPLSPACLQSLTTQYCQPKGTLAQAYNGNGMPAQNSQFNSINQVLQQRGGFSLPGGVVNDGNISSQSALAAFQQLSTLSSQPGLDSRAAAAASNLCNGTPFDPCAFAPTDNGPFPDQCITQLALNTGWSPQGQAMPGNSAASNWQGNMATWQAATAYASWLKSAADTPGVVSSQDQVAAIAQVYGTNINYPKSGCNNTGAFVYRYLNLLGGQFNPSGTPTPQTPITHFLGRYILKNGLVSSQASSMTEMIPGGQNLTEILHIQANWTPMEAGDSNFEVYADDSAIIYFGNTLYAVIACCSQYQVTDPLTWLTPGTTYPLHIFVPNSGGPWSFNLQRCTPSTQTSGGACNNAQSIPVTELSMPQDRRLPMLEYAFHKMQPVTVPTSSSGIPIADTNNVFANCVMAASIGSLNGRQCMIIDGPVRGIFNYNADAAPPNNYVQGMRLHALKSFTMMLCVTSATSAPASANGVTPSIFSMYNLPQSNTTGVPSVAWQPWFAQSYYNRVNDFEITASPNGAIYPFGIGPLANSSSTAQSAFTEAIQSGESISAYPPNAWFHYAWVWDDNGTGYTIYLNGKQVGRSFMPSYDPALIMEQWRIGCDNQPEGASWTGGIQWFRGFDYRLSQDQVTMDMQDGWANLV
jgi:hypothetical protein